MEYNSGNIDAQTQLNDDVLELDQDEIGVGSNIEFNSDSEDDNPDANIHAGEIIEIEKDQWKVKPPTGEHRNYFRDQIKIISVKNSND